MPTDEDLTRELSAAFRGATDDLTYNGRTAPPRGVPRAVPIAAGVAVLAVGAVAIGANVGGGSGDAPAATTAISTPSAASPTAKPKLVTETMTLAGFTVTYKRDAGSPSPLHAVRHATLPADAESVSLTGTEAKAWIGKDPASGDNALYVKAPTRNGGELFALLSSTWTQDQLVDLVKYGEPRPVPAVD